MMNFTWQPYIAFLGAGGNNPRVEAINTDSGEIKKFIELPPMHSAYALDIDIERGTLAVGIKGGLVYIINSDQNLEDEAPLQYETLVQGAPILSVCWINKSILVASDIAGRCLLWDTDRESSPQPLETMEGVICSLLNLPDDKLAGFSSDTASCTKGTSKSA